MPDSGPPSTDTPDSPEAQVDRLNAEAQGALERSPAQAIELAKKAQAHARQAGYLPGVAQALRNEGAARHYLSEYEAALQAFSQGLEAARQAGHADTTLACLNGLGVSYRRLGEFDSALKHLLAMTEQAQELGHERALAIALTNVGLVYDDLGEYDNALRYHTEALERFTAPSQQRVGALVNVAAVYGHKGETAEAARRYAEALAEARAVGAQYHEARLLCNLGFVSNELGRPAEGLAHFGRALALAQSLGLGDHEAHANLGLGQSHTALGDFESARRHLEQGLAQAGKIGHKEHTCTAYGMLSELYKAQRDYASALEHFERKAALEAEVYRGRSEQRSRTLMAQLELERTRHQAEVHRLKSVELAEANRALRATLQALGYDQIKDTRFARGAHHSPLTERELQVIRLVAQGHNNRAIGLELHISATTVRDHVSSVLNKLGVNTRTQAVAVAVQQGWL